VIDLIVLHAISLPAGEFGCRFIEQLFLGVLDVDEHPGLLGLQGVRVSAHFLVDREGCVTQFVPVSMRAWHAGESSWLGKDNCNDYSVGIEIIGDEVQPFTPAQYRETARLCRLLMRKFPSISRDRIVGHSHVAPGRKWDPGCQWNWQKFYGSLARIRKPDMEIR